jgi:hypothetical protein
MSSALLDAPARRFGFAGPAGGGRPTLEELLASTLHAARAHAGAEAGAQADCPLCDGAMRYADGAARCGSCGSTLA